MSWIRVFTIGGLIAYRALFNWVSPWIYIPTMLGSPLFQILFFAYLGRFSGLRDDTYFVVGNAVQVSAMSGIYAMTLTIAKNTTRTPKRYASTFKGYLTSGAAWKSTAPATCG